MTNEELLIEAKQLLRDLCKMRGEPGAREWVMSIPARPNDPDLVFAQLIERFEAGLGAAVSASPQPKMGCPKCGGEVTWQRGDRNAFCQEQMHIFTIVNEKDWQQFFAAAPAQEPDTCPRCEGTGKYRRLPNDPEKPCAVCNGSGKITDSAVQEQPVENSPCTFDECDKPEKHGYHIVNEGLPINLHNHSYSPQKGKP